MAFLTEPYAGQSVTSYGVAFLTGVIALVVFKPLSRNKDPRVAYWSEWLCWIAILECFLKAIQAILDAPFLIGRPRFYALFFSLGQYPLILALLALALVIYYRKRKGTTTGA